MDTSCSGAAALSSHFALRCPVCVLNPRAIGYSVSFVPFHSFIAVRELNSLLQYHLVVIMSFYCTVLLPSVFCKWRKLRRGEDLATEIFSSKNFDSSQ